VLALFFSRVIGVLHFISILRSVFLVGAFFTPFVSFDALDVARRVDRLRSLGSSLFGRYFRRRDSFPQLHSEYRLTIPWSGSHEFLQLLSIVDDLLYTVGITSVKY